MCCTEWMPKGMCAGRQVQAAQGHDFEANLIVCFRNGDPPETGECIEADAYVRVHFPTNVCNSRWRFALYPPDAGSHKTADRFDLSTAETCKQMPNNALNSGQNRVKIGSVRVKIKNGSDRGASV